MTATIKQTEAAPVSYPALDGSVPRAVWQRLEAYVAHRWTPRSVEWIVEGCGYWYPPLKPATISTVEVWSCGANVWETATLDPSPFGGYYLPTTGPYRFSGIVGGGSPAPVVPEIVAEAATRLAAYLAAPKGTPGVSSESIDAGSISIRRSREASWQAKALVNSGAADLLRNFRRV